MDEYIGRYEITRDIHFRPAIGIGNLSNSYWHRFGGAVNIWIGDYQQGKDISPTSIMDETGKAFKNNKGNIEIKVEGDLSQELLKNVADEIGSRFQE